MPSPTLQASVEQIARYLEKLGLEPSALDVADLLWLALRRSEGAGTMVSTSPREEQPGDYEAWLAEADERELLEEMTASETAEPRLPVRNHVPLYAYEQQAIESDEALPLSIPFPTALAGQLDLARALRPLRVRVPMPQRLELDEDASAQQIAETRIWAPVLRPQTTRWLDVTLVVDTAPAMQIWQRTIDQLQRLLECHGAFRNVWRWHLNTDLAETFTLTLPGAAHAAQGRSPRELIDPSGRRLILVISDCVAPAWRSGAVAQLLENLARHCSTALVQVLPYKLWERSALGRYPEAIIGVGKPGEASARLPAKPRRRSFRKQVRGTPLPVTSIEAQGFKELARLVAGQGGTKASGVLLQAQPVPQAGTPKATLPVATLLASFKLQGSEEAKQLARALTVAPLSIPFIHLVHYHSVVSPTLAQLAEVLLSGLIYRVRPLHGTDEIAYEFVEGAREALNRDLLPGQGLGLMRRIAEYISEQSGKPNSFRAMLADPSQVNPAEVWAMNSDFTAIAVDYLLRLGGRYSEIGKLLAQTRWQPPYAPLATNGAHTAQKLTLESEPLEEGGINIDATPKDPLTVEVMVKWFLSEFEDPSNSVPYDSREGGYQYLPHEPYYAEDELVSNFPDATKDMLEKVLGEIKEYGGPEWVRKNRFGDIGKEELYDTTRTQKNLSHLFDNLDDDEQDLLLMAGVLGDAPYDSRALSIILGRDVFEAIEKLTKQHLFQRQPQSGWLRLHRIIAAYADKLSRVEGKAHRQRHLRAAEYYSYEEPKPFRAMFHYEQADEIQAMLAAAARSLTEPDVILPPLRSLQILERQRNRVRRDDQILLETLRGEAMLRIIGEAAEPQALSIFAGITAYVQLPRQAPQSTLARLCVVRAYDALAELALRAEDYPRALDEYEHARNYLVTADLPRTLAERAEVWLSRREAVLNSMRGVRREALQHDEQKFAQLVATLQTGAPQTELRRDAARLSLLLGANLGELGEYARAGHYFEETLRLRRDLGDNQMLGAAMANYGNFYTAQGRYTESEAWLNQAEKIAISHNLPIIKAAVLNTRGIEYYNQRRFIDAELHWVQALNIYQQVLENKDQLETNKGTALQQNAARGIVDVLCNLGDIAIVQGTAPRALSFAEQALESVKKLNGEEQWRGWNALRIRAEAALLQDNTDTAESDLMQIWQAVLKHEVEDPSELASFYLVRSELSRRRGLLAEALSDAQCGLAFAQRSRSGFLIQRSIEQCESLYSQVE